MNGLLTARDVARIMKVRLRTVHTWIKEGKLRAFKPEGFVKGHWRIYPSDFSAFLNGEVSGASQRQIK